MKLLDRMRLAWRLWRGRGALKAGNVEAAEFHLELMEEMAPLHPSTRAYRERFLKAVFDRAKRRVEEDPDLPETHAEYAAARLEAEQPEAADAEVREALRLATAAGAPKELLKSLWREAGKVAFERGLFARARELLDRGEAPGFDLPETQYYRGLSLWALGDRIAARRQWDATLRAAHWVVAARTCMLIEKREGQTGRG